MFPGWQVKFYELLDQVYSTGVPFVARAVPIRLTGEQEQRFLTHCTSLSVMRRE